MSSRTLCTGVVAALLVLVGSVTAPVAARQILPSQAEVDAFVRDVLFDALTTSRFVDIGIVRRPNVTSYKVRSDLKPLNMRATNAALPDVPFTLTLITNNEAEALADQTGRFVSFIAIDIDGLTPMEAFVQVGTDIEIPPRRGLIKLCCCMTRARYEKQGSKWVFLRSRETVCS
jgi:hypothetical protein